MQPTVPALDSGLGSPIGSPTDLIDANATATGATRPLTGPEVLARAVASGTPPAVAAKEIARHPTWKAQLLHAGLSVRTGQSLTPGEYDALDAAAARRARRALRNLKQTRPPVVSPPVPTSTAAAADPTP